MSERKQLIIDNIVFIILTVLVCISFSIIVICCFFNDNWVIASKISLAFTAFCLAVGIMVIMYTRLVE